MQRLEFAADFSIFMYRVSNKQYALTASTDDLICENMYLVSKPNVSFTSVTNCRERELENAIKSCMVHLAQQKAIWLVNTSSNVGYNFLYYVGL